MSAPVVTLVIPCRNEVQSIEQCLGSILQQGVPQGGFEVVVADGMSDDGTRQVLNELAAGEARVRIIDNPGRIVSAGLNAAIRAARGKIIIRMDAHTEYASDYLVRCVETLQETGADNVGGPWVAKGKGYMSCAIAAAFQSPFAVGGARGHNPNYEGEVDTVYLGCWRKETFEKFGYFDEELVRNQDDEHNLRIIRGGGNIHQSPKIKSWYRPRGSLASLFKQYMQYGYWKVRVIQKHKLPASIRHLVPGAFVLALLLLFLLSLACEVFSLLLHGPGPVKSFVYFTGQLSAFSFLLLCSAYLLAVFVASVRTASKTEWKLLPVLPLVFCCYHFGYGYGFLSGVWDFVILRRGASVSFTKLTRASSEVKAVIRNP
jgi:glycosyltransferase involved in cell wall biosynthesis